MSFNRTRLFNEAAELRAKARTGTSLTEILIRCKTMARFLNNKEMVDWIDFETTGSEGLYYLADEKTRQRLFDASPYRLVVASRSLPELHSLNGRKDLDWDNLRKLMTRIGQNYFTTSPIAVLEGSKEAGIEVELPKELYDYYVVPILNKVEISADYKLLATGMRLSITATNILSITNGVRVKLIDYLDKIVQDQPLNIVDMFYQSMDRIYNDVQRLYPDMMGEFEAIHLNILQDRPENFSNVASACRRILKKFADIEYPSKNQMTPDGHLLAERFEKNRIIQWIKEKTSATSQTELVSAHFNFLTNYIDSVYSLASKGDKNPITKHEAELCSIHTYFIIAELLRIKQSATLSSPSNEL